MLIMMIIHTLAGIQQVFSLGVALILVLTLHLIYRTLNLLFFGVVILVKWYANVMYHGI